MATVQHKPRSNLESSRPTRPELPVGRFLKSKSLGGNRVISVVDDGIHATSTCGYLGETFLRYSTALGLATSMPTASDSMDSLLHLLRFLSRSGASALVLHQSLNQ